MLVHAATKDVKTAAASPRGIAILHCSQLEHVEVPRGVINVEAVIKDVGAIAIVNLVPHQIGQADLLAAEFWERHRQLALRLVSGVINDDDMAAAVLAGPGAGDKAARSPVAGPGRQWLDLRPGAVAEGSLVFRTSNLTESQNSRSCIFYR